MTREEAITIMQLYKDELAHRIAKIDYDIREIDLYSIHLDAFEVAIEALSAETEPTVIRCKTLLNAEDFEAVATRIRKENRNVIVIPCETEVASAEAVSREVYEETDGVVTIEKQNAKEVGEIKHIVIRSPNYTRYFYNESMPLPAEAVHKPDYSYEADMVKRLRQAEAVQVVRCKDCRWYRDTFFHSKVNPYCVKEFDEEFGALRSGITEDSFCSWGERKGGEDE